MKKKDFFIKGKFYLISNHGNGGEELFKARENYFYFLKKENEYMREYWDLIAWALVPKSYGLLVKVKPEIPRGLNEEMLNRKIYSAFRDFTSAYSKAINKAYERKGNLFARQFSREMICCEEKIKNQICKLHYLPLEDQLTNI